jgi:hypothetical protein
MVHSMMQARARLMLVALVLLTVIHPFAHHESTRTDGLAHVAGFDSSLRECPCVHASVDSVPAPAQLAAPAAREAEVASLPSLTPLPIAQAQVPARAPPAA